MTELIKTGVILLAEGTQLPPAMQGAGNCERKPFLPGWQRVQNLDSFGMDQLLQKAGWNFFYIAGGIEMMAYGSDEKRAAHKAVKRILASLRNKEFNCLEITHVTCKNFLGLPYVNVSAHSRHVQKSGVLFAEESVL